MIKKNLFFYFFSLFLFFAATFQAKAGMDSVRAFVNDAGFSLIKTLGEPDLQQKYQNLDTLFDEKVDTSYISKFVLGKYYRLLTPEQKTTYHALFERYIKSLYKSYPLDFDTTDISFKILSVSEKAGFYDVVCLVDLPEKYRTENFQNVHVEFKLKADSNTLRFVDFKIGETSMLITFRNKFIQMIKDDEDEIEWFLEDFADLTKSNEQHIQELRENEYINASD